MITKCLFPAAGYGTRFLPATKSVPKEMLPILNKPLLQYAVEEAISADFTNMAIVTGRGKRAIEDHFDNAFELESQLSGTSKEYLMDDIKKIISKSTFTYVRQKERLGLGHAVLAGKPLIGDEPFAVILADDLCDTKNSSVISQMKNIYLKYKCSVVAVQEIPFNDAHNYGIINGELLDKNIFSISDMLEKPSSIQLSKIFKNKDTNINSSCLAIVGRYILTPDIFKILNNTKPDSNGEIQLTDALLVQAKKRRVIAYKFKGERFDCGNIEGYVEATNYFAKKLKIL